MLHMYKRLFRGHDLSVNNMDFICNLKVESKQHYSRYRFVSKSKLSLRRSV